MNSISNKSKILLFIGALVFNVFAFSPSAQATWPDFGGFSFGFGLDTVWDVIEKLIKAELKNAAIQTLNETINNMVAGTSQAGAGFITDWEDYLFKSPKGEASAYMNDFFTITSRGKSSGNYQSSCAGGGNFTEWRDAGAKGSVGVEIDLTNLQSDFQEFACKPSEMFKDGDWAAFSAFMQPNNNPAAFSLIAENVYSEKLEEKQTEAEARSISGGGFTATESENGMVITPASITKAITESANTAGDKALIAAESWQEITVAVVGKIASKAIKQGIGNARQNVQNEINSSICDASQSLSDELDNLSPNGNLPGGIGIGSLGSSSGSSSCNLQ